MCQPDTVRKAVNELIKLEYLVQGKDKQGRRHLVYTGKEFVPIIADNLEISKKGKQ